MSLSNLPHPVRQFLLAVQSGDGAALSTLLADHVALSVEGVEIRGTSAVQNWFSSERLRWARPPRPINDTKRQGVLVLTMLISEHDQDSSERLVQRDWTLVVKNGDIWEVRSEQSPILDLPDPVKAYVLATNTIDLDGLVAVFHEEAIVNDQLQVHDGLAAIRDWAAREIIGTDLTMHPVSVIERLNCVVVAANVNGSMIAAGMPDPLVLSFYFALSGAQVASLIILPDLSKA